MSRMFAAGALSIAVVAAASIAANAAAPLPGEATLKVAPLIKKLTPAVVSIEISGHVPSQAGAKKRETRETRGAGSGVIYDARHGFIMTNSHVIEHAEQITVTLTDGRKLEAKRVGADLDFDLAVIKVEVEDLTSIPFADSRELQIGDFVLAISFPTGMGQTVSSGIVGGLHRNNVGIEQYENFIQTDAAIYPGSSGGALVNLEGDLVGICTAFSGSGNNNPGMGFATRLTAGQPLLRCTLHVGSGSIAAKALTVSAAADDTAIKVAVRRIGPALVFERLWEETGCRAVISALAGARGHKFVLERAVFLTVLHRLFVSGSDRAADRWREDYAIAGVAGLDLHHLYRRWRGWARNCRRRSRTAARRSRRAA